MMIGHFAIGVATKKMALAMPIWILLLAPQFMDLLFVPLVILGIESFEFGPYGHLSLNIEYSHSLVGALAIAAVAYWIGNRFWKSSRGGKVLASLSFSHWILDVLMHRPDMAILPGNLGNLPLLGLGLWNYEFISLVTEVVMAIIAVILYFHWARKEQKDTRWFVGPTIVTLFFAVLIASEIKNFPMI
ncbi:MAG: permease [Rhizobiales bacterium]|nr:permease [Hyphomicrobiales bacterium]